MSILLRACAIIVFCLSLTAGMSLGHTLAESQDGTATVAALVTPAKTPFPDSEERLRQMANEMMRSGGGFADIEPAAGDDTTAAPAQ